ncbi:type VI secretion system contractile sheath small subunit [Vibrio marisflavi]|uniref:Type VI secretion system contractile sheath small subunit n=1 Tax=Vibrio marisflavi CECT 7928 TaxID=634439 RepID=A0ABN8E0D9_9VIBR|nr:type VI secretion system contractile sheath small subunit [Vibrio marisflavi]CAH0537457.1 hypothetical protein VMF7928_01119 [Vibrio marisflavi CECT 7928]
MAKEGSVAPKERINIKYVPRTGDVQSEIELPLKTLLIGDFKGGSEETPLEDRKVVSIDKNNFESVMKESDLAIKTSVKNRLSNDGSDLPVDISIKSINDFSPDSIAKQVPELNKLIELREALMALKGPLGNIPAFRSKLQELMDSEESRNQLLSELKLSEESDK